MISAVCTLFEGSYHTGVGALINSLYRYGFRGEVFAGYRGPLPEWASKAQDNRSLEWEGAKTLIINGGIQIHFLPVINNYHLTNYKPNFMLSLLEGPAKHTLGIAYFDPDITVKCHWDYYETWMNHGVALVHEIIANDMPPNHPLRMEWKKVILKANRVISRPMHSYINGGFCGVAKKNTEFLKTWIDLTNIAMEHFNLTADQWKHSYDRSYMFYAQDQDVLNIAAMCSESPISEMGPEAMGFLHGGTTMFHALGSPKPWQKKFISSAIGAKPPTESEKSFWDNVHSPIMVYAPSVVKYKKFTISVAALIGRFYRRN